MFHYLPFEIVEKIVAFCFYFVALIVYCENLQRVYALDEK